MRLGVFLSAAATVIAGYELLALLTPLPTISRMVQGLRDAGRTGLVLVIAIVLVCILATFGAWLYHHLLFEARSSL